MPRDLGLPRNEIVRSGGNLESGLPDSRPSLSDRGTTGRSVLTVDQSVVMPPPMSDAERRAISARIAARPGGGIGCEIPWSPNCQSNAGNSTSPGTPGILTGPSDPLETLSDVFRNISGNEGATSPIPGQQALVPVTSSGGGGSSLIWLLILGAVGVGAYIYYRRHA